MSPITHALLGWLVASGSPALSRRERGLITFAGVAPDLDGLGAIPQWLTACSRHPVYWGSDFHHVLGHNLAFAVAVSLVVWTLAARRRDLAAALAFASFQLHIVCDLAGSRGGDGYPWPIDYLYPFTDGAMLTWSGQWALDAWPNFAIIATALGGCLWIAWRRGDSPVELVSARANQALVETLRARFPRAQAASGSS